jgi:peptidoglycan/LPS O-acetylase OafA/YrhL
MARTVGVLERLARKTSSGVYIPQIDGLRFLALIPVLAWHSGLRGVRDLPGMGDSIAFLSNYLPIGDIGVDLFFFISAFIISLPFLSGRPPTLGRFFLRRVTRLEPPYIIVMVLAFVALAALGYRPTGAPSFHNSERPLWQDMLASLFYVHGLAFNTPSRLNPPAWSLEVEIQFYLLCPLILWAYLRMGERKLRLAVGAAALVIATLFSSWFVADKFANVLYWTLLGHAHPYVLGICLCDYAIGARLFERDRSHGFDLCFVAGLAGLVASGWIEGLGYAPGPALLREALRLLAIAMIFLGAARGKGAARLLSLTWITVVGAACYSIYLTHLPIMQFSTELLFRFVHLHRVAQVWPIAFGLLIPEAVIGGMVFHILVEQPFSDPNWPGKILRALGRAKTRGRTLETATDLGAGS